MAQPAHRSYHPTWEAALAISKPSRNFSFIKALRNYINTGSTDGHKDTQTVRDAVAGREVENQVSGKRDEDTKAHIARQLPGRVRVPENVSRSEGAQNKLSACR